MAIVDVCRLCLAKDDLVYIFNEENKKLKMNDIISITTGIEVHSKDIISQKVCNKCYQFSIKIFQFRGQCLKADKYLKSLYMDCLVDKKYYIPNTEVTIKGVVKSEQTSKPKPVFLKPQPTYKVHPSVVNLSRKYPDMKLPKICLTSNVTPFVEMELHQVENHFKRLKLDFSSYVKKALVSSNKYFRRNKINIKTEGDKKICKKESKDKEICRTPKKDIIGENKLKSPVRNSAKRKLIETSSKEKVDETLSKTENCDTIGYNHPSKKKKVMGKCLQNIPDSSKDDRGTDFGIQQCKTSPDLCDENRASEKGNDKRICLVKTERDCYSCTPKEERKLLPDENDFNGQNNDKNTKDSLKKSKMPHPIMKFTEKICTEKTNESPLPTKTSENSGNDMVNLSSTTHSELSLNQQEIHSDKKDDGELLLTNVGRSVPLFVCEICNSVQYNMYELKRHKLKHMRCQFCKIRLRSLENKKHHIENVCMIKKMMQNLPRIELVKVEYNRTIRCKYQEAFAGFSPLPQTDQSDTDIPNLKKVLFKDFPPERLDIIEILSDDNVPPLTIMEGKELPLVVDVTSDVFTEVDLSVSTEEVVKNVRTTFQQRRLEEVGTQTYLPSNDDVTVCKNNRTILKNLQLQLSTYPIAVKLLPGQFNVSFDYTTNSNSVKELCFWNDLTPTDVVVPTIENCYPSSVIVSETPNGNTPDQDESELNLQNIKQ